MVMLEHSVKRELVPGYFGRLEWVAKNSPSISLEALLEVDKTARRRHKHEKRKFSGEPYYKHEEGMATLYVWGCQGLGINPNPAVVMDIMLHDVVENNQGVRQLVNDIINLYEKKERLDDDYVEDRLDWGDYTHQNEGLQGEIERDKKKLTGQRTALYEAIKTTIESALEAANITAPDLSSTVKMDVDALTRFPEEYRYHQSTYALADTKENKREDAARRLLVRTIDRLYNELDVGATAITGFEEEFKEHFPDADVPVTQIVGKIVGKGGQETRMVYTVYSSYKSFIVLNTLNRFLNTNGGRMLENEGIPEEIEHAKMLYTLQQSLAAATAYTLQYVCDQLAKKQELAGHIGETKRRIEVYKAKGGFLDITTPNPFRPNEMDFMIATIAALEVRPRSELLNHWKDPERLYTSARAMLEVINILKKPTDATEGVPEFYVFPGFEEMEIRARVPI